MHQPFERRYFDQQLTACLSETRFQRAIRILNERNAIDDPTVDYTDEPVGEPSDLSDSGRGEFTFMIPTRFAGMVQVSFDPETWEVAFDGTPLENIVNAGKGQHRGYFTYRLAYALGAIDADLVTIPDAIDGPRQKLTSPEDAAEAIKLRLDMLHKINR